MKNINTAEYEIIARQRAKLADGKWGWTGVMRAAYSIDRTVVGFRNDSIGVPDAYRNGAAGSSGERAYAKTVSSEYIERAPRAGV
jgi:hypothetical protein